MICLVVFCVNSLAHRIIPRACFRGFRSIFPSQRLFGSKPEMFSQFISGGKAAREELECSVFMNLLVLHTATICTIFMRKHIIVFT